MNTSLLSFLSQSIATASAILFTFLFCKNIYGCKYDKKRFYIIGYFIAATLMIVINQIHNPYINGIYSFLSVNLICIALFESNIKKIWLHNLLFWFMFCFCDVITVLIWSIINGNSLDGVLSNYQLMLGSNILNIIFMFALYRIYLAVMQKIKFQSIQLKIALFLITMTFFEVWVLLTYVYQITDRSDSINIFILLIGFLVVNVFFTYVLSQVSEVYKYKYELSLAEKLCETHLSNYMEISQKYEEARTIIHDIKKHIVVADNIDNEELSSRDEYLSGVYERMDELFCCFHCSNKILSVVLSQKISAAKSKGIYVDLSVEEVPMDFIDDFDITAIFMNLWDNAIEACEKVKERKYISLSISRFNDFILVNMENSYNGVISPKNDLYISTKPNHDGVGLKSVKVAVKRYEGVFMTKYNDISFRAEITIPIT